jgi:Na+/H+-dicarboxylate symporter
MLLSFSVPGIPGGSILVMAPILASAGIPAAGLGVLLALDTIPDMFRTMTNVSADFTAAALLSRFRDYRDSTT